MRDQPISVNGMKRELVDVHEKPEERRHCDQTNASNRHPPSKGGLDDPEGPNMGTGVHTLQPVRQHGTHRQRDCRAKANDEQGAAAPRANWRTFTAEPSRLTICVACSEFAGV